MSSEIFRSNRSEYVALSNELFGRSLAVCPPAAEKVHAVTLSPACALTAPCTVPNEPTSAAIEPCGTPRPRVPRSDTTPPTASPP